MTSNSLDKYFKSLEILGYRSNHDVETLIILSFLEEMLTGAMSVYITEEDYKIISNIITCFQGTCLIPYKLYKTSDNSININSNNVRNTEDFNIRITEDNLIRFNM